jgi:hypothetical protein
VSIWVVSLYISRPSVTTVPCCGYSDFTEYLAIVNVSRYPFHCIAFRCIALGFFPSSAQNPGHWQTAAARHARGAPLLPAGMSISQPHSITFFFLPTFVHFQTRTPKASMFPATTDRGKGVISQHGAKYLITHYSKHCWLGDQQRRVSLSQSLQITDPEKKARRTAFPMGFSFAPLSLLVGG